MCKDYIEMSRLAAEHMAAQIKKNAQSVLGLATGSTPVGMYHNLIRMCNEGEISFADITTFNLDEYYPIAATHEQSYRYFMNSVLFEHIDIDIKRTHVLDGECTDPAAECTAFDAAIKAAGGIDIQVLGIGSNGHIAFNEPNDNLVSGTHLESLTPQTIADNARFFEKESDVPTQALTMGISSIMHARELLLLVNGASKKEAVKAMFDDRITTKIPATLLKMHPNMTIFCAQDAME